MKKKKFSKTRNMDKATEIKIGIKYREGLTMKERKAMFRALCESLEYRLFGDRISAPEIPTAHAKKVKMEMTVYWE